MKNIYFNRFNYYIFIFQIIITYAIIYFFIFLLLYIFSPSELKERILNVQFDYPEIIAALMYLFTIIAFIFKSRVYIYCIEFIDDQIKIKFQDYNKENEINANICNTKLEFIPAGKNNPFLRLTINHEGDNIILKQRKIKKWDIKIMKQLVNEYNSHKDSKCK